MDRTAYLLQLRPSIEIEAQNQKTAEEAFMHQTLRPVLKFQNYILLQAIEQHSFYKQVNLNVKDEVKKRENLKQFLIKNRGLRNQLIGNITALFTEAEFLFYVQHAKTIEKRIIEMVITRFLSQK